MSPPGQLYVNCMTVFELVNNSFSPPLLNDFGGPFETKRVRGGPAWMYSDFYTIDAQTGDPAVTGLTNMPAFRITSGPMLLAVLEDRFKLRFHRETEEIPVYSLVIDSGGPKLQPAQPGECEPPDPDAGLRFPLPAGQKPYCTVHLGKNGGNWTVDTNGRSIGNFAGMLTHAVGDRPVLDKTGITGAFTFRLVFAHDATTPGDFPPGLSPFKPADIPSAPALIDVLEEQLGLKLVPGTGPHEYIEIDSVERPGGN